MSQEATDFHRKNKIRGSRLSPIVEGRLCGKTIEAVVQLYCVESLRVKLKQLIWRYFRRIKRTSPMLVVIPRCANANVTCHEQRNVSAFSHRRGSSPARSVQISANVRLCVFFLQPTPPLTFFLAAFRCFIDAMSPLNSSRENLTGESTPLYRPPPKHLPDAHNWHNNKSARDLLLRDP
jgi:hypothetical protein